MSETLKDCENCGIRKAVAEMLDLHWHDQYDCPFTCPEDKEEKTDDNN